MAFSDGEPSQIMEALRRIEDDLAEIKDSKIPDIQAEQRDQNTRLDRIDRTLDDNDENNQLGMRSKVNFVYTTVESWQHQAKGARWVVGVLVGFFASGLGLLLINAFNGGPP